LAPDHSAEKPNIRRLRKAVDQQPDLWAFARDPAVVDLVADLVGPDIRFHSSKLNFKWSDGGDAVRWHQDIQAWPHTNFGVLTFGVYLDDTGPEQGPLTALPGTHRGRIFDQFDEDGRWTGALVPRDVATLLTDTTTELCGPAWNLLVRGGTLVDPAQSISARRDVAFRGGKVAAVAETLTGEATEVIDAAGALVTPGLIDIHTHVYHGLATGRHADQTSLANGVTTVVDAGSAGWMTLRGLRDYVIPTYQTRVSAFLHISATGLTINRIMPELADIKFAQVEEAARTAAENRGLVLGIKVRIAHGATGQGNQANAREALRRGRQAADLAGVRLMGHG